jgi:glutamyl-tRNA synthetase
VGGARTALYNWLWARRNGGTFILRIEDTDDARSTQESTDQILESMRWLGLDWDEGPFYQSQRGALYAAALERLADAGLAYRAFEKPEELDAQREAARAEGRNWVYDRAALRLSPEEVQAKVEAGDAYIWRFKVREGPIVVPETLLLGSGEATFDGAAVGDFPLTRSTTGSEPASPLYNFCCAVDDAEMRISHVIRGNDHLTNTAKQIAILEALGAPIPTYTHLPLILKNAKKMSKRDADADPRFPVSVSARRDLGYLPEATVNFLALLGWALDDKAEFFPREELTRVFNLEGLSKSNANFDEDKYLHLNALWIRALPRERVAALASAELHRAGLSLPEGRDNAWLDQVIALAVERVRLVSDFPAALDFFFAAPSAYEVAGVKKQFSGEGAAALLDAAADALGGLESPGLEAIEAALRQLGESLGLGFGKVAQPVRLALTGRMASPGLFEVIHALGCEESAARLRAAATHVRSGDVPLAEAP